MADFTPEDKIDHVHKAIRQKTKDIIKKIQYIDQVIHTNPLLKHSRKIYQDQLLKLRDEKINTIEIFKKILSSTPDDFNRQSIMEEIERLEDELADISAMTTSPAASVRA